MSGDKDVVSENIVQLIFNQVKESIDKNTEAVNKLAEGVTLLIQSIGTLPKETHANVSSLSSFMKLVFGVIIGLFTVLTFVFGYFGIGLNDIGPTIASLQDDIAVLKPLLQQLINKM